MAVIKIYTLSDPISKQVVYVGASKNPLKRLSGHLCESKQDKTEKHKWIISLFSCGLKPLVHTIDECNEDECDFLEIFYISLFKSWGFNLLNMTIGGKGAGGRIMGDYQKNILSKVHKGNKYAIGVTHKRKKVSAIINDTYKEFESVSHAANVLNLSRRAISNNINGRSKKAYGIKFSAI